MDREILFRAKHKEWNEWVKGDLIHEPFGVCIQFIKDGCKSKIKIDPKTVCQYTGLTDKNGRKIFEGDICKRALLPTKRIVNNFRIAYVSANSCFSAIDLDGSNVTFISDYINSSYEVEVIGNVYDNPELLKNLKC